ncbi:TolC family protein [Lutibacter sp. B1]|uniref:TolC family protein n=1 Tax=Lutibacter sp. B1 TaxID=2725996 RepID=UPI001B3A51B4|nr:TolC family protein [Lutibacter sp. B1]
MRYSIHKTSYIAVLLFLVFTSVTFSQENVTSKLTLEEVIQLALKNNQALKVSDKYISIAQQQTEINKLQQLPNISSSVNASYIGDVLILDKDFSNSTTVDMPHFGNTFSVQASQVIFKGNAVNNAIKIGFLQEELAKLDYRDDELSIRLLVTATYLDLFKLYNQKTVYNQNIVLAQERLKNINNFYNQGMVTRNEVIRGELQLTNLKQAVETISNNISILNKQLATAIGLSDATIILPDESLLEEKPIVQDFDFYSGEGFANNPKIKTTQVQTELVKKTAKITKSEMLPAFVAFGGYNMQRPITSTSPALDMYSNSWQVGVGLSFDIESLYKTPKKLKLNNLQLDQMKEIELLQKQNLDVEIKAAYLKYQDAVSQSNTFVESKRLAEENYYIIEKKYLNQLALAVDMLDASNAKLDAELNYTNSEINILYTYYNLLRTIGKL